MRNKKSWNPILTFGSLLILLIVAREFALNYMIEQQINGYFYHKLLGIIANAILIGVSYLFIRKHHLIDLSGLKLGGGQKLYLILPLLYLVGLNLLTQDDINVELLLANIVTLSLYVISVGIAEEISIRGFLQSYLIAKFGIGKKGVIISVLLASLFFGVIHLINFDKGLYGEIAQICFAAFIGVTFGFLLVITKNLYALMMMHALINFFADMDTAGFPIIEKISNPTSFENAILITLLTLPCLVYGLYLTRFINVSE